MTIKAVKCPKCLEIIYSRAHHDFKQCSCGLILIDNGPHILNDSKQDYMRTTQEAVHVEIELPLQDIGVARRELFLDWNNNINKYGRIK